MTRTVKRFGTTRGRNIGAILLAIVAGLVVAGGCVGRGGAGKASDVFVHRYRYNIDEEHNLVRVFGELENRGQYPVQAVVVKAIIRNRSYSKTGENIVVVKNIKPRERRTFSLTVTSHGGASTVECQVMEPSDVH